MRTIWLRTALVNLFLAACIGALLRYAFVEEVSWLQYRKFLHAHSHVAMLGWLYLALYTFFVDSFLEPEKAERPFYRNLFWTTQVTVIGMLLSFPVYGYASVSIFCSTAHVVLSYFFAVRFWKDLQSDRMSALFARTAIVFMILSTLALWGMGPIMMMGLQGESVYYMAIQFYLHYQFNGWFLFGVLALFFHLAESKGAGIDRKQARMFWGVLILATLLTYALSVAWSNPLPTVFYINGLGVIIQLIALIILGRIAWKVWTRVKDGVQAWPKSLFILAFWGLALKILVQTSVVVPYIAEVAYTIRNFVIGFIHLLTLGIFSSFFLGYGIHFHLLKHKTVLFKIGLILFLAGIIGSEALLFLQGMMFWGAMGFMPFYYEALFAFSALLPLGILLVLIGQFWRLSEQ